METVLGILLFILFVWALIKGWVWIVSSIMDPKIKAAEARKKEALKNNPKYQFWSKAEELANELDRTIKESGKKQPEVEKEPENFYVAKHFRIIEGRKQAEELRASFKRGYEQLKKQYDEYLKWCSDNQVKPIVDPPPANRLKVYHID